jgi:hypothetical protein
MSDDNFELVRGSGISRHGIPQRRLSAGEGPSWCENHRHTDDQHISVRRAHELTGFAAADISRVRQAKLQRFTLERLISMLVKLNQDVEISIEVKPRAHGHLAPA